MWLFKTPDPNKQKEEKFRELEADFGENPEHLNMMKATWLSSRGNSFGEQGKLDEAIRDFEEAIQLKPDHLPSYCSLSIAYHRKGMTQKAKAILDAAPEEMKLHGEIVGTKAELLRSLA